MHWEDVAARLAPARDYWLGTTTESGAPHATPVWGVVVDHRFYLYTERRTAKARNIAHDPRALIHLESAEHVVIVHGRLTDAGHPMDTPEVVAALGAKYDAPGDEQYLPTADEGFDVLFLLQPERALLWELSAFETSQERWP